ncbi:N-acetylmuramoyl-L-alanine amidase [Streptomyces sp. 8N114]|uniref:N-acetylmuramoyl-L-alanine amidase n=1 Tax=Streptomyces sp. 8N114 TaxID=3457419 RepID=UPI003FD66985
MGQAADEERTNGSGEPGPGEGSRGSGDGEGRNEGGRRERGVARRRLLIAGSTALGLGVLGVATQQELKRWWWRMPGNDKPRMEGEVDDDRARWVAAADGNLRRGDRPADFGIDRVIIHVTQGSAAAAVKVFRNPAHQAAAHYIVCHDGEIIQMIRELDVAFHASNKEYNERSVGIEHEGWIDRPQDFTDAMYRSSAKLTAGICSRYGFPADRRHILGHNEVPGADHTDPGRHWDWDKYLRLVRTEMKVESTLRNK